jgi:hypothetical protein
LSLPKPCPGLVIRCSYLWRREATEGRRAGIKDRPCAVVLVVEDQGGTTRVVVLPITHAEPRAPDQEGVELPASTKARLGLDHERSWVIVSEANDFAWPGPDLRFVRGKGAASAAYGMLPPTLFRSIRDRFLARARARGAAFVKRGE